MIHDQCFQVNRFIEEIFFSRMITLDEDQKKGSSRETRVVFWENNNDSLHKDSGREKE